MTIQTLCIVYVLCIYLLPKSSQEYHAMCMIILLWSNTLILLSYKPRMQCCKTYKDWMLSPEKYSNYIMHKEYLMILSTILTFCYAFL